MVTFPNCKINLGLHILGKRNDGFHNLETLFYPLPLCDALEVIHLNEPNQSFRFSCSGIRVEGNEEDNTCVKAYRLLQKDFDLPPVQIHLHKTIPTGAGLGGGSSDGAFMLMLLQKKFALNISEEKLLEYALALGSDCPFFLKNQPCIGSGRGEKLEPVALDLSRYTIVVVNPGIHINTGWAFSLVMPNPHREPLSAIIQSPVEQWKNKLVNDFEEPVFNHYPAIREIKEQLYYSGAVYCAMSGSGSTVFAFFEKGKEMEFNFPENYFIRQFS